MNRLERIQTKIISDAFPELAKVTIPVRWKPMSDAYFETTFGKKREYSIDVDCSLKKASPDVLSGGMAHELAHITISFGSTPVVIWLDSLLVKYSLLYTIWDERRTDRLVIKRGYGRELLSFLKYANKRRQDYSKYDGLTVEEVTKLINRL